MPDATTAVPVQPAAAIAAPAPAPAVPAQAAPPDISGLTQPGGQPSPSPLNAVGPGGTSINQEAAATQQALGKAATDAATPLPPVATGPHARLMNMIQGLAVGMGAFGTAIATHGKEGGVPEVQQFEANKEEMAQRAQQAAQAQKDAQLRQDLMMADTHQKMVQTMTSLMTLPDEMTAKHVEVQGQQQQQAMSEADFRASHLGLSPQDFNTAMSGAGTSGPQTSNLFRGSAQQAVDAATQNPELGPNDPYVKNLQSVLQNPNATPKDLWTASTQLQTQQGLKKDVTAAKSAAAAAAATARPKDLNDAVGRLTQAQTAYNANPTPANKQAIADAETARANFLSSDAAEARVKQAAQDGDPTAMAQSLLNGDVAWSQVVSTRRPEFAQAALAAANKLSMAQTGKPFSVEVNEAQYKQATDPEVQQKLKMINGMTDKDGSIDIAARAAANLPGFNEKTANKVFNNISGELGDARISNFHTAMLGLADEYSQVMGKGGGSDSSRQQALDLLHDAYSKNQLAGAIEVMRADIAARKKTLINDNPALEQLFNKKTQVPSTLLGNSITTAPSAAGNAFFSQHGGKAD